MVLTPATKEFVLFFAGLLGIASYVIWPNLRDPVLLPVYGAMIGLPLVIKRDKKNDTTKAE